MTTYATNLYRCPRCRAELMHDFMTSSYSPGVKIVPAAKGGRSADELHPRVKAIREELEALFPFFYTDSFVIDLYGTQHLFLSQCDRCEVLFDPEAYFLSTDSIGNYRTRDLQDFLGYDDESRIVDGVLKTAPSLFPSLGFLEAVSRELWIDPTTEKMVRIGALIQMNHHRRPIKAPKSEWAGWPLPDELSSLDWAVIEQLGGSWMDPQHISPMFSAWSNRFGEERPIDAVPRRPKYIENDGLFKSCEFVPEQWASGQRSDVIEKACRGGWPVEGMRTPISTVEKENIHALLELLGTQDNERVLRAECYRMLGNFDACLAEIGDSRDLATELVSTADVIIKRASLSDPYVALVEDKEFSRDDAAIRCSIPGPGFGRIWPIEEEIARQFRQSDCTVTISALGKRMYLEKPSGRVKAPIDWGAKTLTEEDCQSISAVYPLPRQLGVSADGEAVTVKKGAYCPYVCSEEVWVNIPFDNPDAISLERALDLIERQKAADSKSNLRDLRDFPKSENDFAKVPKDLDSSAIANAECQQLLAAKPKRRASREPITDLVSFDEAGVFVRRYRGHEYVVDRANYACVAVPGGVEPQSLTLQKCRSMLESADPPDRRIKYFANAGIYIWRFRVGAYVVDGRNEILASVPPNHDPASLSLDECYDLLSVPESARRGANWTLIITPPISEKI